MISDVSAGHRFTRWTLVQVPIAKSQDLNATLGTTRPTLTDLSTISTSRSPLLSDLCGVTWVDGCDSDENGDEQKGRHNDNVRPDDFGAVVFTNHTCRTLVCFFLETRF
jgi:hypothetical protein